MCRDIRAPAEEVWSLITEFGLWPEWGPTVKTVRSTQEAVAPAVEGIVVTPLGLALPFVITEFQPGVSWSWRVAGVTATGHRVIPTGEETCRLEFSVPWPFALYAVVLYVGLSRVKRLAEAQTG